MAITSYGTNDPLAVKLWAKRLAVEVLKNVWLARFMGPSTGSVLQVREDTQKSAGDKITYGLRMQLTGSGVIGDGTLEGQEEALTTFADSLVINQLRHAVNAGGKMSQQRVPFSVREEALSGLRDWWADRIDWSGFNQLCGFTPVMTPNGALGATDTRWTGLQTPTAPDSSHITRPGASETADESITSSDLFSLTMLDKAIERARTLTPAIRPVMVGGKPFYPAFLHPYQVTDL